MTLKEAAAILGTTPDNLRQAIARGSFGAVKIGRDWHTTTDEVARYRRENRRGQLCSTCGKDLSGFTSHRHGFNGKEEVI